MKQEIVSDDPDFWQDESVRPSFEVETVPTINIPPSVNNPAPWPVIASTGQELRGPFLPAASLPRPVGDPAPTPAPAPATAATPAPAPTPAPTPAPVTLAPSGSGNTAERPATPAQMLPLYTADTSTLAPAPGTEEAPPDNAKKWLALLSLAALFLN